MQLGDSLYQRHNRNPLIGLKGVSREVRVGKEFPQGQEICRLDLDPQYLQLRKRKDADEL